ncbi:MAG: lysozyme [Parvularculaceae bacterium]|jgi:GH24 family phage-related lysozyme (muramidase)|nr:lysozyme [Parvularculaceae bacterium]
MRTGETGLNLIKGYEGLRMSAYYAPSEQWTVGYGHVATARHGMSVTESEAERLLREDVKPIEALLAETVRAPLNQNEHDALTSLIFSIGADNWRRSTVLRKLNSGDKLGAAQAFELWTRARVNGELVSLDGLVRRRAAEKSLFLMPTDASLVVPTSDVRPAPECEPAFISDAELKSAPLVRFEKFKAPTDARLSPEERASRARALFSATQALAGDPTKMVISKAEEHADIGVTVGAVFAGLLSLGITIYGGLLAAWQMAPGFVESIGFSYSRFPTLFQNAPIWFAGIGAAMSYFIFYILVKRAARHDLKRQRAQEIARIRIAE